MKFKFNNNTDLTNKTVEKELSGKKLYHNDQTGEYWIFDFKIKKKYWISVHPFLSMDETIIVDVFLGIKNKKEKKQEKKEQSSPLLPYIGTVPVTDEIRFLREIESNKTTWYLPGVH